MEKKDFFALVKNGVLINGKTDVSDATIDKIIDLIDCEQITAENQNSLVEKAVNAAKATQLNINSVAATIVKAQKEPNKEPSKDPIKETDPQNPKDGSDGKVEQLLAQIEELKSKVNGITQKETHNSLFSKLKSELKDIPEYFINPVMHGRTLQTEEEVQTYASFIKDQFQLSEQARVNAGGGAPPISGNGEVQERKYTKEQLDAMVNRGRI